MRRLIFVLPLIAFAAVAAWFLASLSRDPSNIPSALINEPAPDFILPALAGIAAPALSSVDLKGKVTLVNVFASWCVPCRAEHPVLLRLAREKSITLYGISYKDRAEDSAAFLRELGNPFAAIGFDGDGRVGIDFGVYGVPETFLIGPDGRVRYKQISAITPQDMQQKILPLAAQLAR